MLARASFGDDPLFSQPLGQKGLSQAIVQLVRPGMEEVLSLEKNPGSAALLREIFRLGERSGPARVIF